MIRSSILPDESPDLSVIVVSYNTRAMTLACLASLYDQSPNLKLQTLVIDNASKDGSAAAIEARFPQVELHALEENLGFAGANNYAAEHAHAEWILLLNPDTVVLRRGIERMLAFARARADECVIGGRTYFADERLNPTSCWGEPTLWSLLCVATGLSSVFRRNAWLDPESLGMWPRDTVREVKIIAGCLLLISKSLWERLGGFDTGFFMYSEDFDLSMRARRSGAKLLICPDAEIIHYAGASEKVRSEKMVRLMVAKAQLYRKHWPPWKALLGIRFLDGWVWSRMTLFAFARLLAVRFQRSYDDWRAIWVHREDWRRPPPVAPLAANRECRPS